MSNRAVIFCWSESDRMPLKIRDDDYIVFADSGCEYGKRCGVTPCLTVGDFDSSVAPEKGEKIVLPAEKDDTDCMFCVKKCIELGYEEIVIAGGIGGRPDHSLGAIASLLYIYSQGKKGSVCDGHTYITVCDSSLKIPYSDGVEYISVFPAGERAEGVFLRGLKYELSDAVLTNDYPLGVSNEPLPHRLAEIRVKTGKLLVFVIFK